MTTLLAAIDIGSSAIRMDIAEVGPGNSMVILDTLKRGVQLGKDAFTQGFLGEESIRAACGALRDFKNVMDSYGVSRYRAVATSAVRESSNSDTFLDRILMGTGLEVEVIDGPEENRLTYAAVLTSLMDSTEIMKGDALLVEIGGGSTDITLLRDGEPAESGTFPLGSIRLHEEIIRSGGTYDQQLRLLKRQIQSILTSIKRSIAVKRATSYIAVGGDLRFVGRQIREGAGRRGPWTITREELFKFVDRVSRLTLDGIVQIHSLSYLDAGTLVPSLLASQHLFRETQAEKMIISGASIRDGILQDLAPEENGVRRTRLAQQILTAARSVGKKYGYDESHADRVREIAELLFDDLKSEHGLNQTHRLYLQVAALLHDIGIFINSRAHHKHSYYLIASSELFGLRRGELELIANIARYHRRALPQRTHIAYMSLDRDERVIVSKLAAILRVANGLEKGQLIEPGELKILHEEDQVVLIVPQVADLTMERVALTNRSDLFHEVFGKKIILRESPRTL